MLTQGAEPVWSVSMFPVGRKLGVTFSARDRDGFDDQRDRFEVTVKVALGGRIAEELVFGRPAVGAVARWDMSDDVRRIVEKIHADVLALLSRNRWRLDALASALLRYETLDQSMVYAAAGLPEPGSAPGSFASAALRATPPAA
jgi:cell division protease FtsH